ncbi:MAG: ATP-grasp fold amidoligase family protein [Pseudomonadota bacterium]
MEPSTRKPETAALLRIYTTYLWRHGQLPNLANPTRFTEMVQLRKLHDRDPRMPIMADKLAVKAIVAERLGRDWVVPMLWSGETLSTKFRFNRPVVVKSRHGCNQTIVISGDEDWLRAHRRTRRWIVKPYGQWLDEWLYLNIPRGLLIEPFIGVKQELPVDYKFFVFHGRATHVQAHINRASRHRWVVHDLDWRPFANNAPLIERPSGLAAMIAAAEELAKGFTFARVDFYQPGEQPLFGEMTFYPGSGLHPIDPPELDVEMGNLWLNAASSRARYRDSEVALVASAPEDAWRVDHQADGYCRPAKSARAFEKSGVGTD